jgi:tellurite resistance protein TerC
VTGLLLLSDAVSAPGRRVPPLDVPGAVWTGLIALVVGLLLLDLLWFNRKAHKISLPEATRMSAFFVGCGLAVGGAVWWLYGGVPALTYLTGYTVELSLSVDNLFVIAVLFGYFGVPAEHQHRVLFWGVFGAILMRAVMILVGVALVDRFDWVLYVFGAFLLFTGVKMLRGQKEEADPGDNRLLRLMRRVIPVTKGFHGEHFFVRKMGRLMATPLFLVLVMIELTDVVFAVDSIPAILGITTDPFLAFASNIMAVLGLRALYFVLAGVIERLRYLHYGLAAVLVFIGVKMLIAEFYHVPTLLSLGIILTALAGSAIASLVVTRREQRHAPPGLEEQAPAEERSDLAPDAERDQSFVSSPPN